ncbi:MAG TPA: lysylphosphatidylglycerol synthase domain-containing protein [Armatimonadota bacterium]
MSLPTGKRPVWWKVAAYTALPLGLMAIFAWQIIKYWPKIEPYLRKMHIGLVVVALLLFLLCSLLDTHIWNRTLSWFTRPLPFIQAAPIYIWSSLARYVPGKVFSLLLRVALAAQVDRAAIPVLASSTVELALRTASASLLFLIALLGYHIPGKQGVAILVFALLVVPLVLVCAHPRVMMPVLNWGLRKIKQPTINRPLRYREVLGTFLLLLARWLVYGLAFFALACSVHPAAREHLLVLVGIAAGSWAVGFAFLMPGGLGIAEWVMNWGLSQILSFSIGLALMLPALLRLTTLVGEGLWALVCIPLWMSWRQQKPVAPRTEVESSTA